MKTAIYNVLDKHIGGESIYLQHYIKVKIYFTIS